MALFLQSTSTVIRDNDAGPFVDNWDKEQGRAKYGNQKEGPEKHSVQNLSYILPVLYHLKKTKMKLFGDANSCYLLSYYS